MCKYIFALTLLIILQGCDTPNEPNSKNDNPKVIFIKLWNTGIDENFFKICFNTSYVDSKYDILKIENINFILDAFYYSPKNLLVVSTTDTLYFINSNTLSVLKKIKTPDTENPEPNYGQWEVDILPYSNDYCILINKSIFLVNLTTLSFETIVFSANDFIPLIYIRRIKQSENRQFIYLLTESFGQSSLTTRIIKVRIKDGGYNIIREDNLISHGYELLVPTQDHLLVFDNAKEYTYRYSNDLGTLVDSIPMPKNSFFLEGNVFNNIVYLQEVNTGGYYKLDSKSMNFIPFFTYPMISNFGAKFYISKINQIHSTFTTTDYKSIVVNLSTKKILREFSLDHPSTIYLKEE